MNNKKNKINLRYGENPNQIAYLIQNSKKTVFDIKYVGNK